MMRYDRERKQNGGQCGVTPAIRADGNDHRSRAESHAEKDRCEDKRKIPCDPAGDLDREHPCTVHGRNAAAHHRTGESRRPRRARIDGDAQAGTCNERGGRKRQDRQAETVGDRDAGLISQHCHEMSRPNAKAGSDRSRDDPEGAGPTSGCTRG
jgi:hypothetical protein